MKATVSGDIRFTAAALPPKVLERLRRDPSKSGAVLFDLVDQQVPQLKRQFQARRQFYRSLGIEPKAALSQRRAQDSRPKTQD